MKRTGIMCSVLLAGAAMPAATPAIGQADGFAQRCAGLAGQAMDDLAIDAATMRASANGNPAHCLVEGMINRRTGAGGATYGIGFELALPEDWNGRYLLMGGGGLNGSIRPPTGPVAAGATPALARGFAVASHDSGHKGAGFDQSFMADQRAALDFAETSVRTVTLATRAIAEGFYGDAPHHSYMTGCSTGGREGMLASQRYPELFDGIVVGAPAMRPGYSNLGIEYAQVMLNRTQAPQVAGPAGFSPVQRNLVRDEILRQCDAADGRADGYVMNVEACRSFEPAALQCRAGQTEGCLSTGEVEALRLGFAGPREASGRPIYVPIPWDPGVASTGPGLPGYLPMGQPGVFGPANASREIDIDGRVHEVEWDAVGRLTDTAYWTNLSTYLARGSKMMFFHGVADPWFSAFDTWDYFQRAGKANPGWGDAARFYMVPGMMHCSGGDAFEQFDLLGPMVDWVEHGKAPAGITARPAGNSEVSRPLCPHPSYAHYDGGNPDSAASYSCRDPGAT